MQTDYQVSNSAITSSALSTNKVLRNTYMMLGLTMIPTVIGAFIGMTMDFTWLALHPIMGAVGHDGGDIWSVLWYQGQQQ